MSNLPPSLYLVACACPPVLHIHNMITASRERGWDVSLVLTPSAALWLEADVDRLAALTTHPVRSTYKLPHDPDVLPPADAMVVAPATFNTLNKWAAGISDTLALGLVTEAIGKRMPLVALPFLNTWQADHPAFEHNVRFLGAAGVRVLLGAGGYTPHGPNEKAAARFPWHLALEALPDPTSIRGQRSP